MKQLNSRFLAVLAGALMAASQASATITTNAYYRLGEDGVGQFRRPLDSTTNGYDFNIDNGGNVVVDGSYPAPGSTTNYVFRGGQTFAIDANTWMPSPSYGITNFGIECWARVSSFSQYAQVFGAGCIYPYGRGIAIGFNTNGFFGSCYDGYNTRIVGSGYVPASTNEWVHLALVWDAGPGVMTFYVNGVQSGPSLATLYGNLAGYRSVCLGSSFLQESFTADNYFSGAVDEARIFSFDSGQFDSRADLLYWSATGRNPFDVHPKPYFSAYAQSLYTNAPPFSFYQATREFVAYSGWWDLWQRYGGQLPSGRGVIVAQAEAYAPGTNAFPDKTFLIDPSASSNDPNGHANTVGKILYGTPFYSDADSLFEYGYGRGISTIAGYDQGFRSLVLHVDAFLNRNPADLPAWDQTNCDVLNISSSMGSSMDANGLRALDYLTDTYNVLTCTAITEQQPVNNFLSANIWNGLVIAQVGPFTLNWYGAQNDNVGANLRVKPDMVTPDFVGGRIGGASSWGCPTVASAAALLLEAARSTNALFDATNACVLKSILMAGASKSGLITPIWSNNIITNWDLTTPYTYSNNPPSQPLDRLVGVGMFNINNAYSILVAGQQPLGVTNQPLGWLRGSGLNPGAAQTNWFRVTSPKTDFNALLTWNRHITDNAGTSYNWTVSNLRLDLYNSNNTLLASSADPGNNVQQLYLPQGLSNGLYYLKVSSDAASPTPENYGLAWRMQVPSGTTTAQVTLTSPTNSQSFSIFDTISLAASVTNSSHTPTTVQYYTNNALLGSSGTGPNYPATWLSPAAGTYSCFAVMNYQDPLGGSALFSVTSAPVTIMVSTPGGSLAGDIWTGVSGGAWNTTTANWWSNGASITYKEGDAVAFSDSAVNFNVTNLLPVSPSSVYVTNNTHDYTISGGGIAGSGGLTKDGTGKLTLVGPNSYSGGTLVNNGMLQIGDGANNGTNNGNYLVGSSATLRVCVNTNGYTNALAWTNISGAGTLSLATAKSGDYISWPDPLALSTDFKGTLKIESGRVHVPSAASVGGCSNIIVLDGGQYASWDNPSFTFNGNMTIAGTGYGESGYPVALRFGASSGLGFGYSLTLASSAAIGAFGNNNGSAFISAVISGGNTANLTYGVPSTLAGNFYLSAANTYSGNTTVAAGTVTLRNTLALQNSTLTSGGIVFASNVVSHAFTLGGLGGNGNLSLQDSPGSTPNPVVLSVGNNGASTVHSGILSGKGRLVKIGSGTLTLGGANTYLGTTAVSNGTLLVTGSLPTNVVTVAVGTTLGGSGTVNGVITNSGSIAPGANAVGTLTTTNETWNPGSALLCRLASASNPAQQSLLNVNGTLSLTGPLTIKLVSMASTSTPGQIPDFNQNNTYLWTVATATSLAVSGPISLDTSAFSNAVTGTFTVSNNPTALLVVYKGVAQPYIVDKPRRDANGFWFSFSGQPSQLYRVLTATNVTLPSASWTVAASGSFDALGTKVGFTNAAPAEPQRYYQVKTP
jgi:autotransporter-associated beta strand protein